MRFRILAAVAALEILAIGLAAAQSAGSQIDQPTPGTLPPGTSTVPGDTADGKDDASRVAPPSAIRSSTDVMDSGQSSSGGRTDPAKHLPANMR